jgi:hypothetical protein
MFPRILPSAPPGRSVSGRAGSQPRRTFIGTSPPLLLAPNAINYVPTVVSPIRCPPAILDAFGWLSFAGHIDRNWRSMRQFGERLTLN